MKILKLYINNVKLIISLGFFIRTSSNPFLKYQFVYNIPISLSTAFKKNVLKEASHFHTAVYLKKYVVICECSLSFDCFLHNT